MPTPLTASRLADAQGVGNEVEAGASGTRFLSVGLRREPLLATSGGLQQHP
jgi:hypothetical protein